MSGSIRSVKQLALAGFMDEAVALDLVEVEQQFATAITPDIFPLLSESGIAKQFVPDRAELHIEPDELEDPIGDQAHAPVKGIVHRHRDRCLLMPVKVCAVYCRFCFRREHIGPGKAALTPEELEVALDYIRAHEEIWEVILTGGDPLLLKPKYLQHCLQSLKAIEHVKVVRIHTRIPMVDSTRISPELIDVLRQIRPLYIVVHVNHPAEFHEGAILACERLVNGGAVLLSQSVLLKGVNDEVEILAKLFQLCVLHRIKPYYLHQLDKARGVNHFEVDIKTGVALMTELRARYSGLCQPIYVRDELGGVGGKLPLVERTL